MSGPVLRTGDPEVCQMRSLPAEWGTCSHMVGSPRAVRSRRRHLCQAEGYLNSLKELLFRQGGEEGTLGRGDSENKSLEEKTLV